MTRFERASGNQFRHGIVIAEDHPRPAGGKNGVRMQIVFQTAHACQHGVSAGAGLDASNRCLTPIGFRRQFTIVNVKLATANGCKSVAPGRYAATADWKKHEFTVCFSCCQVRHMVILFVQHCGDPPKELHVIYALNDDQ